MRHSFARPFAPLRRVLPCGDQVKQTRLAHGHRALAFSVAATTANKNTNYTSPTDVTAASAGHHPGRTRQCEYSNLRAEEQAPFEVTGDSLVHDTYQFDVRRLTLRHAANRSLGTSRSTAVPQPRWHSPKVSV